MEESNTGERFSATMSVVGDLSEYEPPADPTGRVYILVFERGSSWVFELPQAGEVVIGRGEAAELRLRDSSISRRHATVQIVDGRVSLTDLGSHNGTFVNASRITATRELHAGDTVAICGATLVLYASARATASSRWLAYPQLRDRIEQEIERALRYQRPFAVLCGLLAREQDHDAVNSALAALRGLDVGAWVDRTQLLILAPEIGPDEAAEMARRVRELLGELGVKIGYSVCPVDGGDAELLVVSARAAAAGSDGSAVAGATTSLRTYRIGSRNAIVADPTMARLYALVDRLALVDLPVLITGETGTGKELAATMLHERSPRRGRPLVALNCAAIAENLVESELFGHERGAFSGAHATKQGLLEVADGGTVLLDEIGELPLAAQAKLLRVLEAQRLTRVGDVREREIDVRLVAATNRSLQDEVDAGRFRQDLYFRLSGATLAVPPLRDRKRELPLLAELFLAEACRTARRPTIVLEPDALQVLEAYRWPGNIRELKNVMEYCAATVADGKISAAHLAERLGSTQPLAPVARGEAEAAPAPRVFVPIADEIRALEIQRMTEALEAAGGNQTKAAELIGMPLRTFFTKVRQYNLRK